MRAKRVTLTPQTDDNGISVSQTPLAAGNLTITGALASGGAVSLNHGHLILITCAGNDAGRTFTVTGTDFRGVVITEAISGVNIAASQGSVYFKTVTQIAVDAATAGAIIVGVNGLSASNWYVLDTYVDPFSVGFGVVISATTTYSMQHTFEDLYASDISAINVFNHATIASKTVSSNSNYAHPCSGIRLVITAFTSGTTRLVYYQAG